MAEEQPTEEIPADDTGAPVSTSGVTEEKAVSEEKEDLPVAEESSPAKSVTDEKRTSAGSLQKGTPRDSDIKVAPSVEVEKSSVSFVKKTGQDSGLIRKSSKPSDLLLGKGSSLRWSSSSRAITSKARISSLLSIKRASITSQGDRVKFIRYANSYKLESENPFNVDRVHAIIKNTLREFLEDDMVYEPEICGNYAKSISAQLRDRVKEENYDRYKIVCIATVGEKKSQEMIAVLRFMWDGERDHYAHFYHENMYIFIAACVFGTYFE